MIFPGPVDLSPYLDEKGKERLGALKAGLAELARWLERAELYAKVVGDPKLLGLPEPGGTVGEKVAWAREAAKRLGDTGRDDEQMLRMKLGALHVIRFLKST